MQMKIIAILLQNVYVTHNYCVEKTRIFIRKGRAFRTLGGEGLKDCIQCLSEAISTMKDKRGERSVHQLAVAYGLLALCTQEAEPQSKRVFQDFNAALNLWLSIPSPDHCSKNYQHNIVSKSTMILLYNMIDLLSMKNVSPEKCLAALWECRRLSHALCISPVNESFITNFSEQCGELSRPIDFWIRCFNGSRPPEVGFKQSLTFALSIMPSNSLGHGSFSQSYITFDDVKGTALELISAGRSSQVIAPCQIIHAGYLYYDLCERLVAEGQLSEVSRLLAVIYFLSTSSESFSLPSFSLYIVGLPISIKPQLELNLTTSSSRI